MLLIMGYRSSQEPAPTWALHVLQLSSGHTHLLWHGILYRLQDRYLPQHGPRRAAERQPSSPWSSSEAAGKSSFTLVTTQLLLSHFSQSSLTQLLEAIFTFPWICHRRGITSVSDDCLSFGHKQVHLGDGLKWLCPTWVASFSESSGVAAVFSQKLLLQAPCFQNLAT